METRILSGRRIAEQLKAEATREIEELAAREIVPGLAAVLVGDNPASRLYVSSKTRTCSEMGVNSETVTLSGDTTTGELTSVVEQLNRRDDIDGILVQLPLPSRIGQEEVLMAVDPAKDVDGFHPVNVGRLMAGSPFLVPATPLGIMELIRRESISLEGARAVVVGRSNIVGKPMALLLLHQHATVTLCHSRTADLPAVCREADLLIAAVGRPALITREYLKQGAVVIDVGTNRVTDLEEAIRLFGEDSQKVARFKERGSVLVGDVHPRDPLGHAAAVTPVPGGVGPLTIAQVVRNTISACRARRG